MIASDQISVLKTFISDIQSLQDKHGLSVATSAASKPSVSMIIGALEHFNDIVRYANGRRSKGATLSIDSEDDVQDAIYFMLKPWIRDLTYETPTAKEGGRYTIKDFKSKQLRTAIEAKYVRSEDHAKAISKELHDDIEMYGRSHDVDHIVFFVYDPNSSIVDPEGLRTHIEVERTIGRRAISVHLLVRP